MVRGAEKRRCSVWFGSFGCSDVSRKNLCVITDHRGISVIRGRVVLPQWCPTIGPRGPLQLPNYDFGPIMSHRIPASRISITRPGTVRKARDMFVCTRVNQCSMQISSNRTRPPVEGLAVTVTSRERPRVKHLSAHPRFLACF